MTLFTVQSIAAAIVGLAVTGAVGLSIALPSQPADEALVAVADSSHAAEPMASISPAAPAASSALR